MLSFFFSVVSVQLPILPIVLYLDNIKGGVERVIGKKK